MYKLCTKDGTPEQSRNAVVTMAALVNSGGDKDKIKEQQKAFEPLLKTLTASSSMCLATDGKSNKKIVNVFTTLTAMAESVPMLFMNPVKNDRANKAVRFALESILLGKDGEDEIDEPTENDDDITEGVSPAKRRAKRRKDQDTLSLTCQRAIAAIEFLVCYIRSTLLFARKLPAKDRKDHISIPTDNCISSVFDILVNLVRDGGLLPSIRGRLNCNAFPERAALRKSAAVSLLRLCDGSLNIESKYLSPKYWHILSRSFLDQNYEVRGTSIFLLFYSPSQALFSTRIFTLFFFQIR
jgi:hypothetical protein